MAIDYEAEYNNRARVPEHPEIFARWAREAEDYRARTMQERRAELGLMYGSSSTYRAFQISSFGPAERAGVTALLAIAWNATAAAGSVLAGAVRTALGDAGWTANILTLIAAYAIAAALTVAFFASHRPAGDLTIGDGLPTAPHSVA